MIPCCSHVTASSHVPQRYSLQLGSCSAETLEMVLDIVKNTRVVATRSSGNLLFWVTGMSLSILKIDSSAFIFEQIIFILADKKDNYKILDEFELCQDPIS